MSFLVLLLVYKHVKNQAKAVSLVHIAITCSSLKKYLIFRVEH